MIEIKPQPGPQRAFLETPADIALFGGSGGAGKSWSLLLDPLRYINRVTGYGGVVFRRTYPEIKNQGGLWDRSNEIYPYVGGLPRESDLSWKFPALKNEIKFSHMEYEKSKSKYQGAEICYLAFDELTLFTESMFWFMLSRNRSTCGVRPVVRATCNPDADSWVAELLAYWIDEAGFPIPERSGKIRYFCRHQDALIWADSVAELWAEVEGRIPAEDFRPKSFTFIPAKLEDNPALMEKDPGYRGNLLALAYVDRARLLDGNWKIKPSAGNMFRTEWFNFIDYEQLPVDIEKMNTVRWWDTAASEPTTEYKDPDYTAGVLLAEYDKRFYVLDLQHFRKSPGQTEDTLKAVAEMDGKYVTIGYEIEPGSAAKRETARLKRELFYGYHFKAQRPQGDKIQRAKPLSSAVEHGLFYIVRGEWNAAFLFDLTHFPDKKYHDDVTDSTSAGFNYLARRIAGGRLDLSKMVTTNSILRNSAPARDPTAEAKKNAIKNSIGNLYKRG